MSALTLRLIASIAMLLDHIGLRLQLNHIDLGATAEILRYIGRLAFPIYVFLMVNGYQHTKNRLRYALRLALFAVLSQIPFSLMTGRSIYDPRMNVMVTLLVGLLVIWMGDTLRKHPCGKYFFLVPALVAYGLSYFGFYHSDYGAKGIIMAVVFWYFRDHKLLITLGTLFAVWSQVLVSFGFDILYGRQTEAPGKWQITQTLSLLALPLIFLYNNKPGKLPNNPIAKKAIQYAFYLFYPLHMLLLYYFL